MVKMCPEFHIEGDKSLCFNLHHIQKGERGQHFAIIKYASNIRWTRKLNFTTIFKNKVSVPLPLNTPPESTFFIFSGGGVFRGFSTFSKNNQMNLMTNN